MCENSERVSCEVMSTLFHSSNMHTSLEGIPYLWFIAQVHILIHDQNGIMKPNCQSDLLTLTRVCFASLSRPYNMEKCLNFLCRHHFFHDPINRLIRVRLQLLRRSFFQVRKSAHTEVWTPRRRPGVLGLGRLMYGKSPFCRQVSKISEEGIPQNVAEWFGHQVIPEIRN